MTGGQIYLKCENRQKTGSFKIRGASNKLASLTENGEKRPVVASSAGNHAQGVACAAKKFGVPATIVMPKAASIAKVQATQGYGAKVVLEGSCYDDAYAYACQLQQETGMTILLVSHSMEDVAEYVDRIIVMNQGSVLYDGQPREVFRHYRELEEIGLAAPQVTYILHSLKEKGLDVDVDATTVGEAVETVMQALARFRKTNL